MATLFDDASLVMIPSGYKDDKLYSIKPTSGDGDFTFSRDGSGASPATRVNSAGLIEKGRTNLLLQSNSFDTTWGSTNVTETSGQSGYDGTNDAWKLDITAAAGYLNQGISGSGVKTVSIYAKAGTLDWVRIFFLLSGTDASAYFDLSTGTIGAVSSSNIETVMTDVGNGWYRISVSFNDTTSQLRIYPAQADNDLTATSGNIYIQDAQLEKGLVATSYIETTTAAASAGILGDMPRLDYSGGATCPSLLLEPARTNLVTYSEYFEHSSWAAGATTADISKSPNLSPEGVANCYYVENVSGSQLGFFTTITSGASYTGSFWVRKVSGTGVVTMIDVNNSGTDFNVGTEWTRVSVTATSTSTTGRCYIRAKSIGDIIEVYGAQLEAGSYPTSYVPTYGSATARAADSCSKTGISSLIGQTEGTLFLDYETENAEDNGRLIAIGDGSTNNRILLRNQGSGTLLYVAAGGSSTWSTTYYVPGNTGRIKIGLGYANNDGILFVNGSSVNSDTSVTVPACSNVYIGTSEYGGAEDTNIKVNQALLFKTRLTNSELESLTTL